MVNGITLTDPFLKTSRAKEHLESLRKELKIFRESAPCKLIVEDDRKNQRCGVLTDISDTPDRISLIVGDVFYNLRAALDQLVWCLAKLSLPYPKDTDFPILDHPDPNKFQRRTNGVPAAAVSIIESLQPYHRADAIKSNLLWRLNKMCNIDKHMRIPVHSSVVGFQFPANIVKAATFDQDDVMYIPLALKAQLKRYRALNPSVPFEVVFGDAFLDVECDFDGIEEIYNLVANKVIPKFARFFK